MTRVVIRVAGLALAVMLAAIPASAQVVSSLHVGLGGFFPRGIESRAAGDVFVRNIDGEGIGNGTVTDALVFRMNDFKSAYTFAEYNAGFGQHVELGFGVSGYGRTVPTVYRDVTEKGSGREIDQQIGLRVIPVTVLARFLPWGDASSVQPYVGAGVAVMNFRYSEVGDFVDSDTLSIFPASYRTKGTTVGGVVTGGLRLPINGDIYALSLEGRYFYGVGETGGTNAGFLADKVDLGGVTFNVGFLVRF